MIIDSVLSMVRKANPPYVLAMSLIIQYYDTKIVRFCVDDNNSLVITFPVHVKAFNGESLVLYEIGTVKVPNNDLNETVDNYSTVTVSKP